jgi:hypothetical protein
MSNLDLIMRKAINTDATDIAALGQHIHRIFSRLGDGGKDYYVVIRQTKMAACIGEYGFMDSSDYTNFDTNEELMNKAEAWARAICKYYNVKFMEQISQPAPMPQPIPVPEPLKEEKHILFNVNSLFLEHC